MSRVGYRISDDFATSRTGDFTAVVSSSVTVCDGVSICGSSGNCACRRQLKWVREVAHCRLFGIGWSAHFCHLNHFCHSSPISSIHINRLCQPYHFWQRLSTQSSPVLSTISNTYVATGEVTTFVNKARPLLSTVIVLAIYGCYARSLFEVIS